MILDVYQGRVHVQNHALVAEGTRSTLTSCDVSFSLKILRCKRFTVAFGV